MSDKNYTQHIIVSLAAKKSSELQLVHIFFDSSTFDRVERDVKVMALFGISFFYCLLSLSGDFGCPARPYWRDYGSLHRLLNPKRHRDDLFWGEVYLQQDEVL